MQCRNDQSNCCCFASRLSAGRSRNISRSRRQSHCECHIAVAYIEARKFPTAGNTAAHITTFALRRSARTLKNILFPISLLGIRIAIERQLNRTEARMIFRAISTRKVSTSRSHTDVHMQCDDEKPLFRNINTRVRWLMCSHMIPIAVRVCFCICSE